MTSRDNIIPLNRRQRLLRKAGEYVANMDRFLAHGAKAVTTLLDALPHADRGLMLKIIPLLGHVGRDNALGPLYRLMTDARLDDQLRRLVALQLALASSLSNDAGQIRAHLIVGLAHRDPSIRSACALALGWEGNLASVDALLNSLADPDGDVQAAVVSALASVGDRRVFDTLIRQLKNGTVHEKRCIIMNLWRFEDHLPRIETVYLDSIAHGSADVRLDAVCALAMLPMTTAIRDAYEGLLLDNDPRIRLQVIDNLSVMDPSNYHGLVDVLMELLADKNALVRRAAVSLFSRVD